jgi:Plant transposon protein
MKLLPLIKAVVSSNKLLAGGKLRAERIFHADVLAKRLDKVKLKLFKSRKSEDRPLYHMSTWGQLLLSRRIKDPTDRKGGLLFRRRFRVPYPIFEKIVKLVREKGWFTEQKDVTGRAGCPLELKILGVLRVLGRGYCFDGIEEINFASAEVNRLLFHRFCALFSLDLFDEYCSPPTTDVEIKKAMDVYTRLGLPGCIGSTDCVQIRWERCPAGDRHFHKGKEGYNTLSYEVTCDHSSKIIAVTKGHPGARNDKTILRFDGFVTAIHSGTLYNDVKFMLKTLKGEDIEEKGAYLIVDGGYHKWRDLQCPKKHSAVHRDILWSEWLESVRKGVECLFRVLKGRFRCLKLPIYYQSKKPIDYMFFTCCILHNMLLSFDRLDKRWEDGVNYARREGHHTGEDLKVFRRHLSRVRNIVPTADYSLQGIAAVNDRYDTCHGENYEEYESSHKILQTKLINHFCLEYSHNKIQ